ncbi:MULTISPECIES: cytochrome c1 [Nitrincola]|uniref:Cytochrome c1 n=1 Tax=Nitrincola nitratireducens TaxID=1229521 RepID=W9UWS3_9GAMM|nr:MULTISPECIES: cytochrome c1 [Nitrincola]EXJ11693.1 Cytochrome c1 precursor [Nitrincola nitratireducens]
MKKFLFALLMVCLPAVVQAAASAYPTDSMKPDLRDQASLQRGMALYVNRCMGCHSMEFQRFERTADDIGLPHDLVEEYLIRGDLKIHDQMTIAMSKTDAAGWFGAPPPDLTLEARLRGTDWLYTYLRTFYRDDSRPWGVNNALFKDVGMPNVLEDLQGVVINNCTSEELEARGGFSGTLDPLTGTRSGQCLTVQAGTGSMSPAEFDQAIYDLVNFMAYVGEPSRLQSERIGTYVLIFLAIFTFFAYLLKREYWRDIH